MSTAETRTVNRTKFNILLCFKITWPSSSGSSIIQWRIRRTQPVTEVFSHINETVRWLDQINIYKESQKSILKCFAATAFNKPFSIIVNRFSKCIVKGSIFRKRCKVLQLYTRNPNFKLVWKTREYVKCQHFVCESKSPLHLSVCSDKCQRFDSYPQRFLF